MEQGARTSKGQQTQESAPGPEEANAAWPEWNKSDWIDVACGEMGLEDHFFNMQLWTGGRMAKAVSEGEGIVETILNLHFNIFFIGKIPWRRNGNPIQYSYLEKFHRQRSLAGCCLWSHKESDTSERAHTHTNFLLGIISHIQKIFNNNAAETTF